MRDTPRMPVWQWNYYEHVVRNEKELELVREYIRNNPAQWDLGENNPANAVTGGAHCIAPLDPGRLLKVK
jgi:hypothetical protein